MCGVCSYPKVAEGQWGHGHVAYAPQAQAKAHGLSANTGRAHQSELILLRSFGSSQVNPA